MNVKIDSKRKMLVIELPMNHQPMPSSSGKTLVVASTNGFRQTGATVEGKVVSISINATIPNK